MFVSHTDRENSSTHNIKKRHILRRVMSQGTGEKSLKSDPKVMMVSKWLCSHNSFIRPKKGLIMFQIMSGCQLA